MRCRASSVTIRSPRSYRRILIVDKFEFFASSSCVIPRVLRNFRIHIPTVFVSMVITPLPSITHSERKWNRKMKKAIDLERNWCYYNCAERIRNEQEGEMRIDNVKLDLWLARQQKSLIDLRSSGISPQTLTKVRRGEAVKPKTVGGIAAALGVDPTEIIKEE